MSIPHEGSSGQSGAVLYRKWRSFVQKMAQFSTGSGTFFSELSEFKVSVFALECMLGCPEYSLVAWICYTRAVSGTFDSAEKEYDHIKFPRIETLHFHRHFASCVTSGP